MYLPLRGFEVVHITTHTSQYGDLWPLSFNPQREGLELVSLRRRPKQGLSLVTGSRLMYHLKVSISRQEPNPIIELASQTSLSRPWLLGHRQGEHLVVPHDVFSTGSNERELERISGRNTISCAVFTMCICNPLPPHLLPQGMRAGTVAKR